MVVTVGFFDGVHLGHKRVLRLLQESGEPCAAVTMWPHPRVVFQQDARDFCLLSTMDEKMKLIRSYGVEDIRCLNFDASLAGMTAAEFIEKKLKGEMGCTHLVLGYDNRLGSDGLSTTEVAAQAENMGVKVTIVEPYRVNDCYVSSTRIRNSLLEGDVATAAQMLGYRYSLTGVVVAGNRIGRTMGYPTANLRPIFPLKAVPCNGVYATEVFVNGEKFKGMTNIGFRPTLGDFRDRVVETNIFDFDRDIYGMEIQINFITKIRSEQCFPSLEELKNQLAVDKHRCYGIN